MPSRVQWQGLAEFQAVLRNLPDALAREARNIGESAANAAAVDIRTAYGAHRRKGKLQESVRVTEHQVAFGFRYTVRVTAPHAHFVEFGTAARHYVTEGGVRHETGAARAFHVFLPRIRKWQRVKDENLIAMMERHGLIVTGHAG